MENRSRGAICARGLLARTEFLAPDEGRRSADRRTSSIRACEARARALRSARSPLGAPPRHSPQRPSALAQLQAALPRITIARRAFPASPAPGAAMLLADRS